MLPTLSIDYPLPPYCPKPFSQEETERQRKRSMWPRTKAKMPGCIVRSAARVAIEREHAGLPQSAVDFILANCHALDLHLSLEHSHVMERMVQLALRTANWLEISIEYQLNFNWLEIYSVVWAKVILNLLSWILLRLHGKGFSHNNSQRRKRKALETTPFFQQAFFASFA